MAASDLPLRIVSPRRTLIVLGVVCGVFAAMGVVVLTLAPTHTLNLIVGIAAIGFFGVGGGYAVVTQLRKSLVLEADAAGIRIPRAGDIPWADVDRIGSDAAQLGIRLRRYDALADAPTAEYGAAALRASRAQNGGWDLAWPTRLLDRPPAEAARELQRLRSAR